MIFSYQPKGCDNAPRKQIVIEFTVALVMRHNDVIKKYADESIVWDQLQENKKVESLSSFITAIQDENNNNIIVLEIYQVITHGKFASINGVISLANGTKINFCDVYTFSNAAKSGKVKEIKSYRLPPIQ
ncbi:hypothetical protein GCM10022410_19300 [Amphibacillus indicireducens]|uniref:Nuclear transport factor 2 family protein n=2 Tax=Amphibacillus indicireducens TaxID=1076330 RepID=A0ABP7VUN3_9BACI